MKIKINSILKNVYGEPLKSQRKKPQTKKEIEEKRPLELEDLTLREVIFNSLISFDPKNPDIVTGEEKELKYKLIVKMQDSITEVDLDSKEVVLIKELISKTFPSALVSGQAWNMIEP